jgi:guanyl-specific ribonuclease Sa
MKKILLCLFLLLLKITAHSQVVTAIPLVTNPVCNDQNTGEISVFASGGTPPYYYKILPNPFYQVNNTFSQLSPGTYQIEVKDSNDNVSHPYSATINGSTSIASNSVLTKPIDCISNAEITVTATGGTAPYTYSKDGITFAQSNVFENLPAGNYIIYTKDANGCTKSSNTITISPLLPLSISATVANVHCTGNSDGTITIGVSGGGAPFYYSIDKGVTYVFNNTFAGLSIGTYNIITKDALNCTSSIVATITEPTLLSTTAAITKPIDCMGSAIVTLTATGGTAPYTYSKDGITFAQSNVFDNLTAGNYTIYAKDVNGCITQNSTVISPLIPLNTIITKTDVNCNGNNDGSITVNANGGQAPLNYSIDNGVTYVVSNTFTNLAPGAYNIKVKDALNCTSSMTTTIVEPVPLSMTAAITKPLDCISNATLTLTATGGTAPYTYSKDGITFTQSNVFDNLTAGNYTIYAKDVNGCVSQSSIVVSPLVPINATIAKIDVLCTGNNDGSITVTATGGQVPYTYSLDNGLTYVSSTIFTGLATGTYNVIVKDANNCTSNMTTTIIEPSLLSATAAITKTIDCISNATVTATATGGTAPYTYSKDGITFVQSNVFDNLTEGPHTFFTKDVNGCEIEYIQVITTTPTLVATATATNINCKGNNTGLITISTTGGNAPYTYSLDNGSYINGDSSMTFANLNAGTHTITVKDANGCLTTTQALVSEPISALITVTTVKNQTVTITASGGTGEIKYAISPNLNNFSTNNIFSTLTPGSYTILISDANGCFIMTDVLVDPPAPLLNGQIKLTLEFKLGQTLADLIIDGQNIKWYINQNPLAGKTSKTNEDPLPLSTVIEDGKTYYASQTINGIESIERLAVTVKSGSLGLNDLVIKNFKYYPNPVKNILTISNTSNIDEVILTSIKGEILLTKRLSSLSSEIDLSNFSKGVYFLKIKTEGTEKTVKIIKE